MNIAPLGESAYILRELERPPFEVAAALNHSAIPGVIEAVASYETVGVYVDPDAFDVSCLKAAMAFEVKVGRQYEIPVCYEMGEDLEEAAVRLGLTPDALIDHHTSAEYRCFAIGFCPGFPYLGYLPEAVSGLPRRAEPRIRIEPGSVAITGRQTGIYPLPRPGGWWLIGRTPLTLVDVEDGYFPLEAGDRVRFVPITQDEFERRKGERP